MRALFAEEFPMPAPRAVHRRRGVLGPFFFPLSGAAVTGHALG